MTAIEDARAAAQDWRANVGKSGYSGRGDRMAEAIERLTAPPTADEREACGDWPAPCNCDDPDTHDGALRQQGSITDAQVHAAWLKVAHVLTQAQVRAALEAARDA